MAKNKEKNPFLIEKYRIISEISKNHMKRSNKELILMSLWFFFAAAFAQTFFIVFVGSLFTIEGWEIEGLPKAIGPQVVSIALFAMVVVLLVPFYRSLKRTALKLYYMFRDEYRTLYMSGLDDGKMMWQLVNYPIIYVAVAGGAGCGVPIVLFHIEEVGLAMLCVVFVIGIVLIAYKIMANLYNKNFMAITGLESADKDICISKVDGSCRLISWLNVEENIALPYRMLRGKDSVVSNEEISYMARDMNLDGLLRVEAGRLTPLHRLEVMILRAYSVAGKEMILDERMTQGLSEADIEQVNILMARIKNPNISAGYTPNNVVKNRATDMIGSGV